jgi:exodeoxyribonuclease X
MTTWIFADTETTGLSSNDKIVEIAWVKMDENYEIIGKGESLIKPNYPISPGASAAHHLTEAMLVDSPTIEEYMDSNGHPLMVNDAYLICHNVAFDWKFLKPWMLPDTKHLCTLKLAKRIFPDSDSRKLQALRYEFNLSDDLEGIVAHRAMSDVAVMINLLEYMCEVTGKTLPELYSWSLEPTLVKTMKFGKHKGSLVADLPRGYVNWLLEQSNLDEDLRFTLNKLHG